MVCGHKSPAADAEFGIAFLRRRRALNELHARPDAAGILPAAAGTAEPFAENGAGQHQPAFVLLQWAVQGSGLPRRAHANRNQRSQQVGGNGQPRAFGDVVDVADNFQAAPGPASRASRSARL